MVPSGYSWLIFIDIRFVGVVTRGFFLECKLDAVKVFVKLRKLIAHQRIIRDVFGKIIVRKFTPLQITPLNFV